MHMCVTSMQPIFHILVHSMCLIDIKKLDNDGLSLSGIVSAITLLDRCCGNLDGMIQKPNNMIS
jgi:hypothetical protein